MAANLQAMVDASRKAGAQVLLVGMRMPPNYGPDYTARFEAAFAISPKPTACAWCPS
jgi:acyl-CoA thioesterase-1